MTNDPVELKMIIAAARLENEQLQKENARLTAILATLETALERYGKHDLRCNALNSVAVCTCGCALADLLYKLKTDGRTNGATTSRTKSR